MRSSVTHGRKYLLMPRRRCQFPTRYEHHDSRIHRRQVSGGRRWPRRFSCRGNDDHGSDLEFWNSMHSVLGKVETRDIGFKIKMCNAKGRKTQRTSMHTERTLGLWSHIMRCADGSGVPVANGKKCVAIASQVVKGFPPSNGFRWSPAGRRWDAPEAAPRRYCWLLPGRWASETMQRRRLCVRCCGPHDSTAKTMVTAAADENGCMMQFSLRTSREPVAVGVEVFRSSEPFPPAERTTLRDASRALVRSNNKQRTRKK